MTTGHQTERVLPQTDTYRKKLLAPTTF